MVHIDLSGNANSGGNPLINLVANAIATAINTAASDYVDYAKQANKRIIYTLPAGPYNPMHMKDQNIQFDFLKIFISLCIKTYCYISPLN